MLVLVGDFFLNKATSFGSWSIDGFVPERGMFTWRCSVRGFESD